MGDRNRCPGIDPAIAGLIALKAKRMRHQQEFREEELGDLQQMLNVHWLEAEAEYDPSRGDRTQFADAVLDNYICKLVASRNADKRAWWRCQESLDGPVEVRDEAGLTGHDVYDRADYFSRMGEESRSEEAETRLQSRLQAALAALGPRQREYAVWLMTHPKTQIATAMGVHRSTLYAWREEIRRVFERAGLRECL